MRSTTHSATNLTTTNAYSPAPKTADAWAVNQGRTRNQTGNWDLGASRGRVASLREEGASSSRGKRRTRPIFGKRRKTGRTRISRLSQIHWETRARIGCTLALFSFVHVKASTPAGHFTFARVANQRQICFDSCASSRPCEGGRRTASSCRDESESATSRIVLYLCDQSELSSYA